jgi:hypothetical protein
MFDSAADRNPIQTECFDPFPEPHTLPSGWDLSALFPELSTAPASGEDPVPDEESE